MGAPLAKGAKLAPLYAAAAALVGTGAHAGVLPDDRADLLYHSYSGGGVSINGFSLMGRKKIGEHVSVLGNLYTDSISGASIDDARARRWPSPACASADADACTNTPGTWIPVRL